MLTFLQSVWQQSRGHMNLWKCICPYQVVCVSAAGIMVEGAGVPPGTPLTDPPVIEMISEDPVLRGCKLIAEAWDCDGLSQVGAFPHYGGQWAEWNGHFRDTVRQFIKVCRPLC